MKNPNEDAQSSMEPEVLIESGANLRWESDAGQVSRGRTRHWLVGRMADDAALIRPVLILGRSEAASRRLAAVHMVRDDAARLLTVGELMVATCPASVPYGSRRHRCSRRRRGTHRQSRNRRRTRRHMTARRRMRSTTLPWSIDPCAYRKDNGRPLSQRHALVTCALAL